MLEDSIAASEAALPLKPDNEARIVWDTPYVKTKYSIVYLPGNGATQEEGDPMHEAIAHRYGCNMYLARLHEHGLVDSNPLIDIEPDQWMQSALDAIAVGKALGDSVILMTCSTGSTFGIYLAATYPDLIHSHIMLSPNIDVFDPRSGLLVQPWGLQITRFVLGSNFYGWDAPTLASQYWYTKYRAEGLVTLKSVIKATMKQETFEKIDEPVFIAYYYRDDDHLDKTVSVSRMREMFDQLGTPDALKREVALTDAGTHIIGSSIFNHNLESLWQPLTKYCEEVLKLPVADTIGWQPFLDTR